MSTRIGIIGVGAIGSVVGGLLTKAGHDVTLVDEWADHVEAMKKIGLRLSGTCGEHPIPVRALLIHELQSVAEPFDAVFISVKSYATEWALALGLAYLKKPAGIIVDFQNGINDERVAAVAGRERCLGCVITIGAGMYEPGHAIRTDRSQVGFKIGEHDGRVTERAERIAKIMCDVAPTKVTTNLWGERWSKLSVNCMANGLAGSSPTRRTSGPWWRCCRDRRRHREGAGYIREAYMTRKSSWALGRPGNRRRPRLRRRMVAGADVRSAARVSSDTRICPPRA